uniref:Uncharacterized protein n=1 Tax=Arion vulgaris TaxID=1028688 RepID=A0A0B7BWF6_9EUPU
MSAAMSQPSSSRPVAQALEFLYEIMACNISEGNFSDSDISNFNESSVASSISCNSNVELSASESNEDRGVTYT